MQAQVLFYKMVYIEVALELWLRGAASFSITNVQHNLQIKRCIKLLRMADFSFHLKKYSVLFEEDKEMGVWVNSLGYH